MGNKVLSELTVCAPFHRTAYELLAYDMAAGLTKVV